MKQFRLNLGFKLSIGFAFLAITFLFFSWFTYQRLQSNKEITTRITNIYLVSEAKLNELRILVGNSKMLIKNWVYIDQTRDDTPDKKKLKDLINKRCPEIISEIQAVSENWAKEDKQYFNSLAQNINDSLFPHHKEIMNQLNSFDAYQDEMTVWMLKYEYFEGTDSKINKYTKIVEQKLNYLTNIMSEKTINGTADMEADFESFQKLIVFLAILIFILSISTAIFSVRMILGPIKQVKNTLHSISEGVLENVTAGNRQDEIGDMLRALDRMKNGLQKTADFAIDMGNGNYSSDYTPLSEKDQLGNSLITLRDNLSDAQKEANERKEQDRIQNWTTNGVAKFANIMRVHNNDIESLGRTILHNLVKYLEINQGGLYIYKKENNRDEYLELVSMYAYNKEKFKKKRILLGEGLVGVCFMEKKTVLIKEVPDDYISITSGMGHATPKCILIVPLTSNEESLGVIELASFTDFKDYQVAFIEQISEGIAATISNIQINNKTQTLLDKSNEQAELMRSQEEEMRQNLEELQTTQEEFNRKKRELESELQRLHSENKSLKGQLSNIESETLE